MRENPCLRRNLSLAKKSRFKRFFNIIKVYCAHTHTHPRCNILATVEKGSEVAHKEKNVTLGCGRHKGGMIEL